MFKRLAILVLAGLGLAAPAPEALQKRAITPTQLSTWTLYEQFVAAAYCPSNNFAPGKLTCSAGNCPLVQASDTSIIAGIHSPIWATTGYVAVDRTHSLIMVSFRGTENLTNYFADAYLPLTPVNDICVGCTVHRGFLLAWRDAKTAVLNGLATARRANPSFKVVISGHSFGAAVATIAATEIRNSGVNADLYSIGGPRISNPALAKYITNQSPSKGALIRLQHADDPVPLSPSTPPYYHPSPGYDILSATGAPVTTNDVVINPGIGSSTSKFTVTLDVDTYAEAHRWYFGPVTSCYPASNAITVPTVKCDFKPFPIPSCSLG